MSVVVEADRLTLAYGSRTAVGPSDFTVAAGALTAVIGPNGSGKSTLLHSLVGILRPTSGRLRVLGQTPEVARRRVSYVLQSVAAPSEAPITVRETVEMGRYPSLGLWRRRRASDRDRVDAAMDRLEVTDLRDRHLTELSGGQRQRVYVAQGFAQDHDVLVLDEPLTGLDLPSARTIHRIIRQDAAQGRAVVFTTHSLEEALGADHVLLMGGTVLASGPPEEVLTRHHLDRAYGFGALAEITER